MKNQIKRKNFAKVQINSQEGDRHNTSDIIIDILTKKTLSKYFDSQELENIINEDLTFHNEDRKEKIKNYFKNKGFEVKNFELIHFGSCYGTEYRKYNIYVRLKQ